MAFRQPTHYTPQRTYNAPEVSNELAQQQSESLDESQEWILFSPGTASNTIRTYTASTQRTQRTAGRSQISDFGSLDTAARSYGFEEESSEHTEAVVEDEEDGELDSLDSHLHEFRADPSVFREPSMTDLNFSTNPVLPTHDGLGSFRIDQNVMGHVVQEHLYAFERFNPRRIKRRRESLELGQVALEAEQTIEYEKIRRVEEWRLDQSRAFLEEIQRETRRRRQSRSTDRRSLMYDGYEEEAATLGTVTEGEKKLLTGQSQVPDHENESFWSRITRRVIQDLMGIDDKLLSILFGESLPDDEDIFSTAAATQSSLNAMVTTDVDNNSWEYRLFNRIARELGLLVNQLSEHPGTFSTYVKTQQMPLPYAGLPIIPEVAQDVTPDKSSSTYAASVPEFRPTIQVSTQPLNISGSLSRSACDAGIATDDVDAASRQEAPIHRTLETQESLIEFTKEDWEKQLDIKMVFRYLQSRFTSRPAAHTPFVHQNCNLATSSPQDAAARAARVQAHHPLVTRRTFKAVVPSSPIVHRRGSSCASQSTRKSVRRNSGSSRHYWDINGSIGSGSIIASGGAWGDV